MAVVNAEVRFAPQLTAWFTANPTKVLQDGEIVYCSDGANIGKYVIGDNSTQLSALTFYGGLSSSGLTIGTTTITSGTNTRILYNNAGVVGEYLVTGTGTTAVLSDSPQFTTRVNIGNAVTTNQRVLRIGQDTAYIDIGSFTTSTSEGGIWLSGAVPSQFNFALRGSGSITYLNGNRLNLQCGGVTHADFTDYNVTFSNLVASSGARTDFTFTTGGHTNQTLSTNIPNFKVTGSTKQWATGALATQYFNYFSANTVAFAGASTATNVYGLYVEAATAGTNATITNNYAAGFSGAIQVTNNTTTIDDFTGAVTGGKRLRVNNSTTSTTSYAMIDTTNNGGAITSMGTTSGTYTGSGLLVDNTHFFIAQAGTAGKNVLYGANNAAMNIKFINGGTATTDEAFGITSTKNVTVGNAALATTATDGFLYVTACAGIPTGVPTAITGRIPIVADSTNNKLYIYSGGAWVALN